MTHTHRSSRRLVKRRDHSTGLSQPSLREDHFSQNSASLILFHIDRLSNHETRSDPGANTLRMEEVAENISKTIKHSDALVARYGIDGFAVLLRQTDFENAVRVVGTIDSRLESLGYAYSSTQPLVIQVGPASSLWSKMNSSLSSLIQANRPGYVRSPERECL